MKNRLLILSLALLILPAMAEGQPATDDLVSSCVLSAGENTTYLKDFRVQLPKAAPGGFPGLQGQHVPDEEYEVQVLCL
jgi:hypothetical protein